MLKEEAFIRRLQYLDKIGHTYWVPKIQGPLEIFSPILFAKCFIILSKEIKPIDLEVYTIFQGMMKVLELGKKEYTWSYLLEHVGQRLGDTDLQEVASIYRRYQPYLVIIFGKDLGERLTALPPLEKVDSNVCIIKVLEHPAVLHAKPELKKEAYRTLLSIKQALNKKYE